MGKHRNAKQDRIFLNFMTAHPGIARGFCKGDKVNQEEKWKELSNLLNDAGPPTKDVFSWKKAWTDWKSTIRKKLYRKKAEDRSSDGESEEKYGLSKIESSINFISDLENQLKKRDDSGEFVYETSNPFQSPISSPNLSPQPAKKRKHEGLRESFLEALTQSSVDDSNSGVEIKVEKEDEAEEIFDDSSNHYQSIDSSYRNQTNEKRKSDYNISETVAQSSKGLREEKVKGSLENLENKLNAIGRKLDALGGKYDTLIALKKEQIEEIRRDRKERRRHNLEIEKHNSEILAIKSQKKIKSEKG